MTRISTVVNCKSPIRNFLSDIVFGFGNWFEVWFTFPVPEIYRKLTARIYMKFLVR